MEDDGLPDHELMFLLGFAFQQLLTAFVAELDAAGYDDLRPVHGFAFQILMRRPTTSSELGQQLGITKQAAGQMVDHLQERGYVERRPHPLGGRRRVIALTTRGHAHLQAAGAILHRLERSWTADLGPAHVQRLTDDLVTLLRAWSGGNPLPPLRPIW